METLFPSPLRFAKHALGASFMETRDAGDATIKITNSKAEWPSVSGLALGVPFFIIYIFILIYM